MFENMTVNELKFVCKVLRVDIGKITKKADILSLINATGFTHEDYINATNEQFTYQEAEEKEEAEVEVLEQPEIEKVIDHTTTDSVIVKMIHPRGALNVANKAYFTFEEPFQVFTKEKAEEILRLGKDEVRLATPEEVKSFYQV